MKKTRTRLIGSFLAGMCLATTISESQPLIGQEQVGQARAITNVKNSAEDIRAENLFDLNLTASSIADPVLKNRLYPDRRKMFERNAAIYYHRAAHLSADVSRRIRANNQDRRFERMPVYDSEEKYQLWFEAPLDEMPVADMQDWIDRHDHVFIELERARRSAQCHWQIFPNDDEEFDFFSMTLEEVQEMRAIARMLVVKARLCLRNEDFEGATYHLATGFKIAHDLGKTKSMVGNLVGVACVGLISGPIRTLQGMKGSPNLYWALRDLPAPLVDIAESVRSELRFIFESDQFSTDPTEMNLSPEGWRKLLHNQLFVTTKIAPEVPQKKAFMDAWAVRSYPVAKQALLESGMDLKKVDAMPVLQVVAIQQQRVAESFMQSVNAIANLPYSQRIEWANELDERFEEISNAGPLDSDSSLLPTLDYFMPAIQQVYHAEARMMRQLAAVATIEAIRAHSGQTGTLPEKLGDITCVPLPNNPASGAPFDYQPNDVGAVLKDFGFMKHSWRLYNLKLAK